jgi:hypothetical protein
VSFRAVCIDPAHVRLVWPKVSDLIKKAMLRADLGSFGVVETAVLCGNNLLWLAWDDNEIAAAVVTEIGLTDRRKVCSIVACGGRDLDRWLGLISEIEAYAKAEGCSATRIMGRNGWERKLPAYRPFRVVLERTL